ncbi:hypothetical protein ACJJTC_003093 [Scirpophaga incertulas]
MLPIRRYTINNLRLLYSNKVNILYPNVVNYYATTVDMDSIINELLDRYRNKNKSFIDLKMLPIRYYMDGTTSSVDVSCLTTEELSQMITEKISKKHDRVIRQILLDCRKIRRFIDETTLNKLFRYYSSMGKSDMVNFLQTYCIKTDFNLFKRSGYFMHFTAKAECHKGNSEKGLNILKECYKNHKNLRSIYRCIFKELIQDTVLNRSEASLVIFKRCVIEFSHCFKDHYPLICFWHLCWASTWFSDQVLADELFNECEILRDIIRDKSTAFTITILRNECNEDAVMRLLQAFLKFDMIEEYTRVLQVLFTFKLKNNDLRGCMEIMKNCEVLGITLPAHQQGKYINMLISDNKINEKKPTEMTTNFKFKF